MVSSKPQQVPKWNHALLKTQPASPHKWDRGLLADTRSPPTASYNLKAHKLQQLVLENIGPIHERWINPLLMESDNGYDFSFSKFKYFDLPNRGLKKNGLGGKITRLIWKMWLDFHSTFTWDGKSSHSKVCVVNKHVGVYLRVFWPLMGRLPCSGGETRQAVCHNFQGFLGTFPAHKERERKPTGYGQPEGAWRPLNPLLHLPSDKWSDCMWVT